MRYPTRRYGSAMELRYWMDGACLSAADVGRQIFRDRATVFRWLSGDQPIPFWVCELLRYRTEAALEMRREVAFKKSKHGSGWTYCMRYLPLDTLDEAANEEDAVLVGEKVLGCHLSTVDGGDHSRTWGVDVPIVPTYQEARGFGGSWSTWRGSFSVKR